MEAKNASVRARAVNARGALGKMRFGKTSARARATIPARSDVHVRDSTGKRRRRSGKLVCRIEKVPRHFSKASCRYLKRRAIQAPVSLRGHERRYRSSYPVRKSGDDGIGGWEIARGRVIVGALVAPMPLCFGIVLRDERESRPRPMIVGSSFGILGDRVVFAG